jgi:hypothetical protein
MADRRDAVSGLALRPGKECSLLETCASQYVHWPQSFQGSQPVPSLISTLKEEANLCCRFFCLLHRVKVVEMTDFRKHHLPFAYKSALKEGAQFTADLSVYLIALKW